MAATKVRKAGDRLTEHFTRTEMACRCRRPDCDAPPMRPRFLQKLEALRVAWGKPLFPTSAARCSYWNRLKGGSPKSQHLLSNAADFFFEHLAEQEAFAALAEKFGFLGIGKGGGLVHIDDRDVRARWTY